MEGKGRKKSEFKKWPLFRKFNVTITPVTKEEEAILNDAEDYVSEIYIRNSFFNDPTKALVVTAYNIAMDFIKLKRSYEREQVRIKKLMEEIKELRDSL